MTNYRSRSGGARFELSIRVARRITAICKARLEVLTAGGSECSAATGRPGIVGRIRISASSHFLWLRSQVESTKTQPRTGIDDDRPYVTYAPRSPESFPRMQTIHLRCIPPATSLSPLCKPLPVSRRLNQLPRARRLTEQRSSAYCPQKRRLTHNLVYNRVHLHAKPFSTDSKPPTTTMSETVIREVAKDVWIFSK